VTRHRTDDPVGDPALDSGSHAPEMLALLRSDGMITSANDALCRRYGLTPEQLVGEPFTALVIAEDARRVEAELFKLAPDNRAVVTEAQAVMDSLERRRLRWTHLGVFDRAGLLLEIHSFGQDVTHQQQVEEDSARLTAIVAGADDAILSKTLNGIITSWNPAAQAMFGFAPAEAIGQSITNLIIPPDRLHEETEILARLRRGEKTEHFETERLHKDGRLLPVSVNVSPVRDSAGRIIGASKIARDMTDQRRAQENLHSSINSLEALYRLADRVGQARDRQEVCEAALDAITAAMNADRASILTFDATGTMRFVAWRRLSDRYRQAMDGHSPWSRETKNPAAILVENVSSDPSMAALRNEIVREGIRALAFIPLVHQDRLLGKFMVYFDRVRPFTADERRLAESVGRHVAFGLIRVDAEAATAEALLRERSARNDADVARGEAEQASRAKDEFLAMLAHELRNPLGVIVHAVELLASEEDSGPDRDKTVSMIERQSRHLTRLLDDLLDVARIRIGHIQLDAQPLDLRTAMALAIETQRVRIDAKRQQVIVSVPRAPVTVMGDAVRLQQVVGNLVNNASKYTPHGGSIWVELTVEAAEAVLRVRDTGAGVPEDRLDAIFDLFVQANPTLARTEGGLGVGLTLVRRVVDLHAGRVDGHSEGLGKGAEFVVRLPLAKGDEATVTPPAASPRVSPRRILIIEDHQDGREALATLLRVKGHDVYEAANGRDGLALAERHQPEVALVDIGLPDLDGYAVGEALRSALGSRIHLVALTGYGQPRDRERALEAGFEAHLLKPVDVQALLETVASFG
jgi:PAS domain S-box-containing protein